MVRNFTFFIIFAIASASHFGAMAQTRQLITGRDPERVKENAFKKNMDYPVDALVCNQRCYQWWEKRRAQQWEN